MPILVAVSNLVACLRISSQTTFDEKPLAMICVGTHGTCVKLSPSANISKLQPAQLNAKLVYLVQLQHDSAYQPITARDEERRVRRVEFMKCH